jgi:hypothetical protein
MPHETPIPHFADPGRALLAWGWESVPGVPVPDSYHGVNFRTESLSNNVTLLDRDTITPGAVELEQLDSKIETGGDYEVDALNPEQDWFPFFSMLENAHAPITPAGETDTRIHRLSLLESAVAAPETFSLYVDRHAKIPQRLQYGRFNSIELDFGPKKTVSGKFSMVANMGDFMGDPVRVTGGGTGLPVIRGVSKYNFEPYVNVTPNSGDHYVKITAVGATTYTAKVKIGGATAYGTGTQPLAIAGWTELLDQDLVEVGTNMLPVEVYCPAGLVVGDEIRVPNRRASWVAAFADQSLVAQEVSGRIFMDDIGATGTTEAEFISGKISISVGAEAPQGYGRQFARRTRTSGPHMVKIDLTREYLDNDLLARIQQGTPFALQIDVMSKIKIGTSTKFYNGFRFIAPRVKAGGKAGANISNAKNIPQESVSCKAFKNSDSTYPGPLTVEVYNSITDLLAA